MKALGGRHFLRCCSRAGCTTVTPLIPARTGSKAGNFRFYNANIETILFSNGLGGAGFSGISGNFYPFIMSALCPGKSQNKSLREEDRQNLQAFISLAEVAIVDQ